METKIVTAVILVDIPVPADWSVQKVEYHLRKGYVALGEVYDTDGITDYVTVDNVLVRDDNGSM